MLCTILLFLIYTIYTTYIISMESQPQVTQNGNLPQTFPSNETTSIPQHSVNPRSLVITNDKRFKTKVCT